jgi:hypothetical protein
MLSPDCKVIWLTAQSDVSVTPAAGRWWAQHLSVYEGDLAALEAIEAGKAVSLKLRPPRAWWYGSKGKRLYGNRETDGYRVANFPPADDDLMRLTVSLPADDPALHRCSSWPHRTRTLPREIFKLPHIKQWWVHTGGHIAPDRIIAVESM